MGPSDFVTEPRLVVVSSSNSGKSCCCCCWFQTPGGSWFRREQLCWRWDVVGPSWQTDDGNAWQVLPILDTADQRREWGLESPWDWESASVMYRVAERLYRLYITDEWTLAKTCVVQPFLR